MEQQTATSGYDALIESILDAKNVSRDDGEVYEQLKNDLLSQLEDCINAAVLNRIPDDQIGEFNRVLDLDSEAELAAFYERVVPSLPTIVAGEMLAFKNRFVA